MIGRSQAFCLDSFFALCYTYIIIQLYKGGSLIKLAIPFHLNQSQNDDVKEFNILFYKTKNRIEDLIEFIQEYENTRINIQFPDGVHLATLKSINKVSNNIYCRVRASDMIMIPELKENNIKFFFDSDISAYNYSTLAAYINYGVSDVYITDDLCYDLKNVNKICAENNVQMRLILNHIPSTTFDSGTNPRSPIFMPKDMDILNQYFDVFEFDCGNPYDWAKFDVLYRTWFENKYWHGQLNEINEDVAQDFNCDSIYPDFTKFKINCQRRCDRRVTNHCTKCESFIEIGKTLQQKNVRYR